MAGTADAVVCGASIAGAAAAHELAVRRGLRRLLLVMTGCCCSRAGWLVDSGAGWLMDTASLHGALAVE